jgi:glutamate racemase
MNSSNGPIGLFDSGVGGLTVARAIARRLPKEDILYFGDTAHLPYGEKSPDSIRKFSLEIANHLIKKGAKIIVIACNSASAIAYEFLSEKLDIPVFNVIDPIIQELEKCKSQNIGIWGTRATINSNVYQKKLKKSLPNAKVRSTATPLLVPLIEENQLKGNITESLIKYYLDKSEVNNDSVILPFN